MKNDVKKHTAIGYVGEVNVKVKDKTTTILSKTYHNSGTDFLFKFLCRCLMGAYRDAETLRPFKIRLYHNPNDVTSSPYLDKAASGYIATNGQITPGDTAADVNNAVIIHFQVPFSAITDTNINQVCLYGANETIAANYSAYYYFVKDDK